MRIRILRLLKNSVKNILFTQTFIEKLKILFENLISMFFFYYLNNLF